MEKLDYFAFTALILGFVLMFIYACISQVVYTNKIRELLSWMSFTSSMIMFGLFGAYCIYLWISFYFTL